MKIELDKRLVLGETRLDELLLDHDDKEVVEPSIDNENDDLFDTVPDDIDSLVRLVDSQLCRYPDAEDSSVQA